jgi:PAS domain S-box-containing protein
MLNTETLTAILESLNVEIVFTDNDHIIRYMNAEAKKHYHEKLGYSDLIGKPLFDCHNPESCDMIRALYKRLQQGEDVISVSSEDNTRYSIVAVRDENRKLLGYYERNEKIENT